LPRLCPFACCCRRSQALLSPPRPCFFSPQPSSTPLPMQPQSSLSRTCRPVAISLPPPRHLAPRPPPLHPSRSRCSLFVKWSMPPLCQSLSPPPPPPPALLSSEPHDSWALVATRPNRVCFFCVAGSSTNGPPPPRSTPLLLKNALSLLPMWRRMRQRAARCLRMSSASPSSRLFPDAPSVLCIRRPRFGYVFF
jgi:hypothetical protein